MKTFAILATLAVLVACASAASVPFKSCGSGSVTVKSVDISGDLAPGSSITLAATGTASKAVTGGSFTLEIQFFGITVLTETGNICSSKYFHVSCPVAVGSVNAAGNIAIPSAAPAGSYTVQISAKDTSGDALFCVSAAVTISATAIVDDNQPAVHKYIVDAVNNNPRAGWSAELSPRFHGRSLAYAKQLCGTRKGYLMQLRESTAPVAEALPVSFDSRSAAKWSNCSTRLSHVRDQADCGSCWAFGSTEAFNDRLCISTAGKFQAELSAQDTTSCCTLFTGCGFSQGCGGGDPSAAWNYFVNTGVVTGGDYDTIGSGSSCFPYQLPNCAHHEPSPKYKPCPSTVASTPACPNPEACSEKTYGTAWNNDKHFAKSAYSLGSVEQIQTDIMTYGPVTAAFTVYQDFLTYRSGVYKHLQGPELGGHAVKIIGWGVENGEDYWLVANSWNIYWGDNGFFKIARGIDECGIESDVSAGHA